MTTSPNENFAIRKVSSKKNGFDYRHKKGEDSLGTLDVFS